MPCPRTQQANLPDCFPQPPMNAERQTGKLQIPVPIFKVFRYDSTTGMNTRSTDCKADALTTMPWRLTESLRKEETWRRGSNESQIGKEKWQACWCCRDQQRAYRMVQASAEKLEHTGPAENERMASVPQREQLANTPEPPLPKGTEPSVQSTRS